MTAFLNATANGDLYAHALGAAIRGLRIYDPDYALLQDPDSYAKIRRDAKIAFAIEQRKHLVAGKDWFLEPASTSPVDRKCAAVLEYLLKKIKRFAASRFNLAEAVIAGSSWAQILGETRVLKAQGDVLPRRWFLVTGIHDVSKLRMRQARDPASTHEDPRWRWEIYRPLASRWEAIVREHWVHHVYDEAEETLAYGRGLMEAIYHYWYAKSTALAYGVQYLDRWANGMITAAIDSLRQGALSTDLPASARAQAWRDELDKMRRGHVLVHDQKDEVKIHDAPRGGWDATLAAINYFDDAITQLILGSILPTGGGGDTGSFARAKVEQDSTDALLAFDKALLEETMTRDVVDLLYRVNRPCLVEIGCVDAECPSFRIREDKHVDPEKRAGVILQARQAGLQIRQDEAYAQLGFTPPAAGDAVLPPPSQSLAIPGALPGAGGPAGLGGAGFKAFGAASPGGAAGGVDDVRASAGVFIPIPEPAASQFPRKAEDSSPPHITVLYVGDLSAQELAVLVAAARIAAQDAEPFDVEMTDYGEFTNDEGATIAHMVPRADADELGALHDALREVVERAGLEVEHHPGPLKPHATLEYVSPGGRYEGPRPQARWTVDSIEVWSDAGDRVRVPLGVTGRGLLQRFAATRGAAPSAPAGRTRELELENRLLRERIVAFEALSRTFAGAAAAPPPSTPPAPAGPSVVIEHAEMKLPDGIKFPEIPKPEVHVHVEPTPVTVEAKIDVKPTPITIENNTKVEAPSVTVEAKIEPTPVTVENVVNVAPAEGPPAPPAAAPVDRIITITDEKTKEKLTGVIQTIPRK